MSNVLILGSGGREHAITAFVAQDEKVNKIYCAPGNPGTQNIAENISIDINDNNQILELIRKYNIDFTVVGPEGPLENGIVDFVESNGHKIFGPTKYAAQLETSKLFARDFMEKYHIPQPSYFKCDCEEDVMSVSTKLGFPIVLKADGLAAGKGVIICRNQTEMEDAMDIMFKERKFGNAANSISVEECLKGEEVSIFIACDGMNYKILNSAQDHKRAFDNDEGPNTGGMGAYCPAPLVDKKLLKEIEDTVIVPTIKGMASDGHPYKGFLYIGLMIVDNKPFVIEFNARLGDPETQVVLPMIEGSLFDILTHTVDETLESIEISNKEGYMVTVVLSAKGYPGKYYKGMIIHGLDNIDNNMFFHAGTKFENDRYYSNGGRVLNIMGYGETLEDAVDAAYKNINLIDFEDMFFRKDIGSKGLKIIKGIV